MISEMETKEMFFWLVVTESNSKVKIVSITFECLSVTSTHVVASMSSKGICTSKDI